MAMRSMRRLAGGPAFGLATGLALACVAGACSTTPNVVYAGPGWYLEKPRPMVAAGPQLWSGPFSYDQCEAERTKLPLPTAERMLCIRQLAAPGVAGPYITEIDVRWSAYTPTASPDAVTAAQERRVSSEPRP
jgi:hypothetical protein